MTAKSSGELKGHAFQILLSLADRDRHGLEIMRDVLDRTEGLLHLWPGALYGSLKDLADQGLVSERPAPREQKPGRPRYYGITALGRKACAEEAARLERYVKVARSRRVLGSTR